MMYAGIDVTDSDNLELAADVAGVAVGEVGALHHQDVGDAFDRINPRLRAPSATVAASWMNGGEP